MSRESQLGIAEYIRKQYLECKDKIYGMLLITHSESIVECLKEIGQFNPMSNSSLNSSKLERLGWKGLFDAVAGLTHTIEIIREMYIN